MGSEARGSRISDLSQSLFIVLLIFVKYVVARDGLKMLGKTRPSICSFLESYSVLAWSLSTSILVRRRDDSRKKDMIEET